MGFYKTTFWIICVIAVAGCASSPSADSSDPFSLKQGKHTKIYRAHTLNYNGVSSGVVEQDYKSVVEISMRSQIRSYRFSNYVTGRKEPDVVVVLAISGRTAGLIIYDGSGRTLAQYSRGKARNDSVFFEEAGEKGVIRIKWYIGNKTIYSIFESYDNKNQLGASEVTFYETKLGGK